MYSVRDYKITTTVDRMDYLTLRGRFILEGGSFANWLDRKIKEEIKKPTQLDKMIDQIQGTREAKLGKVEGVTPRKIILDEATEAQVNLCAHSKAKTYCNVAKCPNYSSWR